MIINANAHNPLGLQMDLVYENTFNGVFSNKFDIDLRSCRFVYILFMTDQIDQLLCGDIMPIDLSGPTSNSVVYYKNKLRYSRNYTIGIDGITFDNGGWSNASSGEVGVYQSSDSGYLVPYRIYTIR